jgi:3-oxoacyl-[acyl-carrier protein] reductase
MRRQHWGRIVLIGSEAAELGVPRSSAYVAAKAAQLGLTRSWSRELARDHITVNLAIDGRLHVFGGLSIRARTRTE